MLVIPGAPVVDGVCPAGAGVGVAADPPSVVLVRISVFALVVTGKSGTRFTTSYGVSGVNPVIVMVPVVVSASPVTPSFIHGTITFPSLSRISYSKSSSASMVILVSLVFFSTGGRARTTPSAIASPV